MFSLISNTAEIDSELGDIVRLFTNEYDTLTYTVAFNRSDAGTEIQINDRKFLYPPIEKPAVKNHITRKLFVRACKKALYQALCAFFQRVIPWGSLTGVRPTKLVYDYLSAQHVQLSASEYLQNEFFVSKEKSELTAQIVRNQTGFLTRDPRQICLYVHIPFCPSRCNYCSFVSVPIAKQQTLVQPYIDKLCGEIWFSAELIKKNNQKIHSVYIGGGTPTVLSDSQFEQVLTAVTETTKDLFHTTPDRTEFTCEAGRPETITPKKIDIMNRFGVTRISVNPQTLNPETLRLIGRGHTAEDFYAAFSLAESAKLSVNVDLIAGLANETALDFSNTLRAVSALRPDNITIHTLSRKRGSAIKEESVTEFALNVSAMTEFAQIHLAQKAYLPYYLYRQKLQLENLENIGFCLPGTQCVNNIAVMEEALSVMACGAGAISKCVFHSENRIERFANIKDPALYLSRFDEQLKKKETFYL